MCTLFEHGFLFRVVHINLRTFQNLQGNGSIRIIGQERTTARFAHILHHTANTHRTIQFLTQIDDQISIFQLFQVRSAATQLLLYEADNGFQLFVTIMSAIQQFQVFKCLLLQRNQYTSQQFLVSHCISFQAVGHHIINVLDKYDISIQVVQVLNQGTVTTRTEQQFTVLVAERFVFHIGSHCIRTRFLFRETDVISRTILSLIFGSLGSHQFLEQCTMLSRDSEVYIHFPTLSGSIQCPFYQMFFQRCTHAICITMELEQTFRQRSIVQSGRLQQVRNHRLVVMFRQQGIDVLSCIIQTSRIQVIIECKIMNVIEEFLLKIGSRFVILGTQEFEHILEHTAGSSRSRNKLDDFLITCLVCIPCGKILFAFFLIGFHNTSVFYGSSC